jgi:hypothetical protein
MPTVLRIDAYRFFFYAGDHDEPIHIHIEDGDNIAKFWLDPVRLHSSKGFKRQEINRLQEIVEENLEILLRSWYEYFSD